MAAGLLGGVSGSAPSPRRRSVIRPPALRAGDVIGLVTPASPPFELHRTLIEAGEKLAALGFRTKTDRNVGKRHGYLAGTVKERVSDLHDMFRDPEVKAVMAVRGGYGSAQLLPALDYELIRSNPKIVVGYSDITALVTGINERTGLVTFHGPVAVSTFSDFTTRHFLALLSKVSPLGEIENPPLRNSRRKTDHVWTYRGGKAQGRLAGGNMTVLQSLMGTPYEFDACDALLFFEDVGEEPYDMDRILTQFKQAGKFDRCRGVVFGRLNRIRPAEIKPAFPSSLSVEQVIENVFQDFGFPVCVGLSLGHVSDKPTLPIGIRAELDADRGRLIILEAAVC